jgi:dienelactone hydrolase
MALRLTRRGLGVAVAAAVLGLTVALAPAAEAAKAPKFAKPGPYAAGVTTLALPDREVEVWYPAKKKAARGASPASFDLVEKAPPAIVALLPPGSRAAYETDAYRDIPAARTTRGFPLVLMAHGTAGYREQLSYLATHLASWGFVVASPDILERGLAALLGNPPANPVDDLATMRATEALLRSENDRAGGPLANRIMPDQLAITGQSAGGSTALRFGAEPGLVTAIPLSASGYDPRTGGLITFPDVPTMFVTGAQDTVVPLANVEAGFEAANPPTRLVVVQGAGLASVAGLCPIGGSGGLVGLAEASSLPVPESLERLASDGCPDPALDPDPAWAPIDHAVTAQLRWAFGLDRKPKGLNQKTMDRFAPVVVDYRARR